VLGAFPDGNWPTQEIVLSPSEVLVLYTDGITDTVGEDGRFGEERLRETLTSCGTLVPDEMLRELELALTRFEAGRQADDRAALALRLAAWPEGPVAAGRRVRAGH
jgi:serine phosphatase RsbU (regulator of sigma subunit)